MRPLLLYARPALDLLPGMAAEQPGRRKLAELVPDHVLRYEDRDVLAPVVHEQRVADKVREYGGAARPGLDSALFVARIHVLDLFQELRLGVRALFQ